MVKSQPTTGFGSRLKAYREAAGMTREELGRLAGVAPKTVARYERGTAEPSGPAILDLASALGTTAAALETPAARVIDVGSEVAVAVPVAPAATRPRAVGKRKSAGS